MEGPASNVVAAYTDSLRAEVGEGALHAASTMSPPEEAVAKDVGTLDVNALVSAATNAPVAPTGLTRILGIEVSADGVLGRKLQAVSLQSNVQITVKFESDPAQPCPTFATGFALPDGQIFTSAYTLFDGVTIERDAQGRGQATVVFEKLPLMKGRFSVGAYLFDERALHVYDVVLQAATVDVTQPGVHQGFVQLPHRWQ
jgi:lipopolysaccharide transport system ATP-binding protein